MPERQPNLSQYTVERERTHLIDEARRAVRDAGYALERLAKAQQQAAERRVKGGAIRCAHCGLEANVEDTAPTALPRPWVELRWHDAGSPAFVVWRACSPAHAQIVMRARGADMGHVPADER